MRSNKTSSNSPVPLLGVIIWATAALFFLYEFFLRTFVGSVAHQIIPALKLNTETFAMIGSAYYLAYSLMQIPVGILVDKFGVKLVITVAVLTCAAATFLFANATGFYTALISRFLMGFGSAFAFVCLLVIASTWFPRKFFGFFSGASQFIGTMGPALAGGPLIGVMYALHETWRGALSQVAMFGIILAVLFIIIIRNKPRGGEQTLIFLKPEIPLKKRLSKLFRNKQAWLIAAYSAGVYGSIALLGAIWGTTYLQARGLSQSNAANIISIAWIGYAIGCPLLGAFSDIAKRRKPILVFCAIIGVLVTAAITYLDLSQHFWLYTLLFFGLGIAAAGQNLGFATIAEQSDFSTRATALGLNNGAITMFGAIVPPIISYFIYTSAGQNQGNLNAHDFVFAFTLMPALYLLSTLIAIFGIKETYCKPQKEAIVLKT